MNDENLKPISQTHDEAVANGRKGGIASAESRRRKKRLCEIARFLGSREITNSKGETLTIEEISVLKQWQNAMDGDLDALKWLEKVMGEEFSFLEVDNDL